MTQKKRRINPRSYSLFGEAGSRNNSFVLWVILYTKLFSYSNNTPVTIKTPSTQNKCCQFQRRIYLVDSVPVPTQWILSTCGLDWVGSL